ncbi:MAG TPA: FtsX-like permease family protein, partial [Puia sp.]
LGLQRFDQVYLHAHFSEGRISGGRIEYINLFSLVAIFILLIACINFMNLTTARSLKRAKEVGIRKAIGALRAALIKQFIGESVLISAFAVTIAICLMIYLLPLFNSITQKQIGFPFSDFSFWLKIILITLFTGLISGSYPALFLSSFNPLKVLKGTVKLTNGAVWFRKGLVVFQFVLSIILIMGTIVVSRQVNFIQSKNLGYDRENLIYLPIEGELANNYETWRQETLHMPGIENISFISDNPINLDQWTNSVDWDGRDAGTLLNFEQPITGYDFVKTMKLEMKQGRYFSRDFTADTNAYVINETAAKRIGYTNAVGRMITKNGRKCVVIGVLKDFHYRSMHDEIKPMIIEFGKNLRDGNILVRTKAGKMTEALTSLEKIYKQVNPRFPFTYTFLDEEYKKLYDNEQIVSKLSDTFSFLAIFISCLGLLGLMIFTAEQRTKEIGIRKVLGASVTGIIQLMSIEIIILVIIAIIIAFPVGWWAMNSWLNNYAYKIDIGWWMFPLTGGLALFIALFTISFQAIKAAVANPVTSLRSE